MIKLGFILLVTLVTSYGFAVPSLNFGFKEYKEMMNGYLLGIGIAEKYMDHLLGCLTDQKHLEVDFVELMDKIDKLDFTNLPLTAERFADLYEVLIMSIVEIDLCANDNDDYDKIFQRIYHLMPGTIIKRLMLNFISNGPQIFKDIQDAIDNYIGGNFKQLGRDLGDIMRMILMFHAQPLNLEDYIKLLKGLLKGMNVNKDVEKIIKCADKVPDALLEILAAIEEIKRFDINHINEFILSVLKLITSIKNILKELGVCGESIEEIKAIIEKLSNIDIGIVIEKITQNFFGIIINIKEAIDAWTDAEYETFGLKIGEVIFIILLKIE